MLAVCEFYDEAEAFLHGDWVRSVLQQLTAATAATERCRDVTVAVYYTTRL